MLIVSLSKAVYDLYSVPTFTRGIQLQSFSGICILGSIRDTLSPKLLSGSCCDLILIKDLSERLLKV